MIRVINCSCLQKQRWHAVPQNLRDLSASGSAIRIAPGSFTTWQRNFSMAFHFFRLDRLPSSDGSPGLESRHPHISNFNDFPDIRS
jgi:hypothetical protein